VSRSPFKAFEPKIAGLEDVPLKCRGTTLEHDFGCAEDGPEHDGRPVMRHLNPLPCTVILVHGVNSEGEWFNEAEDFLCRGLNDRLDRWGSAVELRTTLKEEELKFSYQYKSERPLDSNRPDFRKFVQTAGNTNANLSKSPVLRFYWGFKARKGDHLRPSHHDYRDPVSTDEAHRRQYPVSLDGNDCWGGGPFQNGTLGLWQMFRKDKGFTLDAQKLNPITDRYLTEAPPRSYYVHAARRLAYLVATIRKNSPQETVNIVSHSQGTMVAMLAVLLLKEQGVRAPEALFVCNSPYSLNPPGGLLETLQFGQEYVVSQDARFTTLRAVAQAVKEAGESGEAFTESEIADQRLCRPAHREHATRQQYGNLYVYANPHDRVMGASVLRSIGWRGLTAAEQRRLGMPSLKVRMFAENIEAGRGDYAYGMSAQSFGITKDDTGKDTGQVRTDFWFPSTEKVMTVYGVYTPPTSLESFVQINAEPAPWFGDESLKKKLANSRDVHGDPAWPEFKDWSGRLKDFDQFKDYLKPRRSGADARDVAAYKQVYSPTYEVVRMAVDDYGVQYPVYRTVDEAAGKLVGIAHNLTDHSSLPSNEFIVRGVMAWDLAVGLNQSYTDVAYWNYLKVLADWKLSDPYFLENDEGALPEPGSPPAGLDRSLAFPDASGGPRAAAQPAPVDLQATAGSGQARSGWRDSVAALFGRSVRS